MSLQELLTEAKREILCERLNYHKGYPEAHGGMMYLYCTRCESLNHPVEYDREEIYGE